MIHNVTITIDPSVPAGALAAALATQGLELVATTKGRARIRPRVAASASPRCQEAACETRGDVLGADGVLRCPRHAVQALPAPARRALDKALIWV